MRGVLRCTLAPDGKQQCKLDLRVLRNYCKRVMTHPLATLCTLDFWHCILVRKRAKKQPVRPIIRNFDASEVSLCDTMHFTTNKSVAVLQ